MEKKHPKNLTLDAQIDAALEQAKLHDNDPMAKTVEYDRRLKVLVVGLTNGRRLVIPVEDLQGLERATPRQLKHSELHGRGSSISFPDLDVDIGVHGLIEGVYGSRRWMAQLGAKGGSAKTAAKRRASRANGAKGGRPRKAVAATA
jgi:hypothetical protein